MLLGEECRHVFRLCGALGFAQADAFQHLRVVTRSAKVVADAVLKELHERLTRWLVAEGSADKWK